MVFRIIEKDIEIFIDNNCITDATIEISLILSNEMMLTIWKHYSEYICEKQFKEDVRVKDFFKTGRTFDSEFVGNGTPDIVIDGRWYDFKTSLGKITKKQLEEIQTQSEMKYGQNGEVIFLTINEGTVSGLWFGSERIAMMKTLKWFRKSRKAKKEDEVEQETNEESLQSLIENMGNPISSVEIANEGSMENVHRSFLKLLPMMEEFANNEWLPIEELPAQIPSFSEFKKNKINKFGFSKFEIKNSTLAMDKNKMAKLMADLPDKDGVMESMKLFLNESSLEKQTKLAEITRDIATLKTMDSIDVPDEFLKKYNLVRSSVINIVEELKRSRKGIVNTMPESESCRMSKRGTIIVNKNMEKIGIFKKGKPLKSGEEPQKQKNMAKGDDLNKYMNEMLKSTVDLPDFDKEVCSVQNPYVNTKIEGIMEEQIKKGCQEMNAILKEKATGYLIRQLSASRSIEGGFNGSRAKNGDANEFLFFWDPVFARLFVYSRPPNMETTGVVYTWFFIEQGKRLSECWGEFEYRDFTEATLVRSSPFRLNKVTFSNSEDPIGTFFGMQLAMKESMISTRENRLMTVMFMDYSRQLSLLTDIIYVFYKQTFASGSLGRNEIKKKFDNLTNRDCRVVYVLECLRREYNNFTRSAQSKFLRSDTVSSVIDPIFKFRHQSISSINVITFIKQIYQKDDGVDKKFLLSKAFGEEIEHEADFKGSPFNPIACNKTTSEYFADNLFFRENGKIKWEKITYCSEAIHEVAKDVVARSENKIRNTFHSDLQAEETGKNSKVLIFKSNKSFKHPSFETFRTSLGERIEKKTSYESCRSVNLTEALMFERDFLHATREAMEDPSLVNMACKEMENYVEHAILIMKAKDQYGHSKRVFFIQDLASRNINRVMDNSFRGFLEAIEEDMILVEGDEKFKILEEMSKSIGVDKQTTKITEDQTRFGDMMPIEAIESLILSLFELGYFDDKEAAFNLMAIQRFRKRRCLIPTHLRGYIRSETTEQYNLWAKDTHMRKVKEDYDAFYGGLRHDNSDKIGSATVSDGYMEKSVGFILGVLNMIGSVLSAFAMRYFKIFINRFIVGVKVDGKTHSDDAIAEYNLLPPSSRHFKEMHTLKFVKGCDEGWTKKENEFKSGSLKMTEQEVSKVIYLSSVLSTRYFGMRSSLLKWVVSEVGEVLQVTLHKSRIITPNIRYYAAIGKDLPGDSYASDLIAAVSRSFNVFIHGGSSQSCISAQIACNVICRMRFAMDHGPIVLDFNRLPQLGGSVIVHPSLLPYQGFSGNLIRLLKISEKDEKLERQMLFMMNDEEIWKQREERNNFDLFNLSTEYEDRNGAIDVFKDFMITFSKTARSSQALKYLMSTSKVDVIKFAKRNLSREQYQKFEEGDEKEKLKMLGPLVDFEDLSGQIQRDGRRLQKLGKYMSPSFQKSYARIDQGLKLISRTGYLERHYTNPFTSIAKEREIMTLREIMSVCEESAYPVTSKHYKYMKFLRDIYSLQISGMDEMEIPDWMERKEEKISFQERSSYKLIQVEKGNLLAPSLAKIVLSICMELVISGKKQRETNAWRQNRTKLERAGLMDRPDYIIKMVEESGLSKMDIVQRPRLIYRLIVDKRFKQVFKIDDKSSSIFSAMIMANPETGFRYECEKEPEYNDLAKESRKKENRVYNVRQLCRGLIIKNLIKSKEIRYMGEDVAKNINEKFFNLKQNCDLDKFAASFCLSYMVDRGSVEVDRRNAQQWTISYDGNIVMRNTNEYMYCLTRSGDLQLIGLLILIGNFTLSSNEVRHSKLEEIPRSTESSISIFNNQLIGGVQRRFAIFKEDRGFFDGIDLKKYRYFYGDSLFETNGYVYVPWYPSTEITNFEFDNQFIDCEIGTSDEWEVSLQNYPMPDLIDEIMNGNDESGFTDRLDSLGLQQLRKGDNDPYARFRLYRGMCWLQNLNDEIQLSENSIDIIDQEFLNLMAKHVKSLKEDEVAWGKAKGKMKVQMIKRIKLCLELKKENKICSTKGGFLQLNGPIRSLPSDFLSVLRSLKNSKLIDEKKMGMVYLLTLNEVGLNQYVIDGNDIGENSPLFYEFDF